MSRLIRRRWDALGTLHRLRFGDYVAVLWWGTGNWTVECHEVGLRAHSDRGYDVPADMYADDVDDAKRWAIRQVIERMVCRRDEDRIAQDDLSYIGDAS